MTRQQDFGKFYPPPPVSIERPPLMTSAFARPPPPPHFKMTSFSKNPLHSTLIETLNAYLIQLKIKLNVVISLGEYINAVVSRIVIGTLDLKQFLPKFKYFCWRQQGLDPLPPCQHFETPSAADVLCERSLILKSCALIWAPTTYMLWLLQF